MKIRRACISDLHRTRLAFAGSRAVRSTERHRNMKMTCRRGGTTAASAGPCVSSPRFSPTSRLKHNIPGHERLMTQLFGNRDACWTMRIELPSACELGLRALERLKFGISGHGDFRAEIHYGCKHQPHTIKALLAPARSTNLSDL